MGAARLRAIACSRTRDVQMTSRRLRFIQLSHFSRLPLYVSPLFSSTSCSPAHMRTREGGAGRRELRAEREGEAPYHRVAHRGAEERERQHPPPAPSCPSSLSIHSPRVNETLSETLVFWQLSGVRLRCPRQLNGQKNAIRGASPCFGVRCGGFAAAARAPSAL